MCFSTKPRSLELKEEVAGEILQFRAQLRRTVAQSSEDSNGRCASTSELSEIFRPALECCNRTVKAYNDALLADMVTYGSAWPLLPQRELVLTTELASARKQTAESVEEHS